MKKRSVAIVLSLVLVFCCAVGGVLAWLTAKTEPVVNTFTAANIEVTLVETKGVTDGEWVQQMVPGNVYSKDPVVTVTNKTDVDCYLFVKFVEGENADKYLQYTSTLTEENGWNKVNGESDVWYRVVKTTDECKSWHLLDKDEVTVNPDTVTKDSMDDASKAALTFAAYAVQFDNIDNAELAWAKVTPTAPAE